MTTASQAIAAAVSTRRGLRLRYGVVTQASPLKVKLGDASVGQATARLASYTPTLGDQVALLVDDADRLCLGKVA